MSEPFFDFYNCKFDKYLSNVLISLDSTTYRVVRFDNMTGTTGQILSDYFVGLDGATYVNSNVLGRDINITLDVFNANGVLSSEVINTIMFFFNTSSKIRVYSDCNSSKNKNAYLEGYIETLDTPRYSEKLNTGIQINLKIHCEKPYWTVEKDRSVSYINSLSYDSTQGGYIVFTHEETGQLGNVINGFDLTFNFNGFKATGTGLELFYLGDYNYGEWKNKKVTMTGKVFKRSQIYMNTGLDYPYCTRNYELTPDIQRVCSDFYEQPYLFAFPTGYKIQCVLKSEDIVSEAGTVQIDIVNNLLYT